MKCCPGLHQGPGRLSPGEPTSAMRNAASLRAPDSVSRGFLLSGDNRRTFFEGILNFVKK
jgi:hypothetical protein